MLAVSKLIEPMIGLNLFLAVALLYLYISLMAIGITFIGLGLLRALRRHRLYNVTPYYFAN
jgi:hypothetical protein